MITGLYAALAAIALFGLIFRVVRRRIKYKVSLGDGGNEDLLRAIRVHGNYVETVPMALVIIALCELSQAPGWGIHIMGLLLLSSRLSHFFGVSTGKGYGKLRFYGMVGTISVYFIGAGLLLYLYLSPLFS